jgi:hypothetical protein
MMTNKRLPLALLVLTLLAGCGGGDAPADNDGRAASGEVLEGTISDAMLPVDRVRSEPPLEDPEALAKVRSKADDAAGDAAAEGEDGAVGEDPATDATPDSTPATGEE